MLPETTQEQRSERIKEAYRRMVRGCDWRGEYLVPQSGFNSPLVSENEAATYVQRFRQICKNSGMPFEPQCAYLFEPANARRRGYPEHAARLRQLTLETLTEVSQPLPQVVDVTASLFPEGPAEVSDDGREIPEDAPSIYGPRLRRTDEMWEPTA